MTPRFFTLLYLLAMALVAICICCACTVKDDPAAEIILDDEAVEMLREDARNAVTVAPAPMPQAKAAAPKGRDTVKPPDSLPEMPAMASARTAD